VDQETNKSPAQATVFKSKSKPWRRPLPRNSNQSDNASHKNCECGRGQGRQGRKRVRCTSCCGCFGCGVGGGSGSCWRIGEVLEVRQHLSHSALTSGGKLGVAGVAAVVRTRSSAGKQAFSSAVIPNDVDYVAPVAGNAVGLARAPSVAAGVAVVQPTSVCTGSRGTGDTVTAGIREHWSSTTRTGPSEALSHALGRGLAGGGREGSSRGATNTATWGGGLGGNGSPVADCVVFIVPCSVSSFGVYAQV